jgi:hypothetical protein
MFKDRFRKNHPKAEAVRLPLSIKPAHLARTSEENQYERNVVRTGGLHRLCPSQKRNGISDGASGGSIEIPGYRNCYCSQMRSTGRSQVEIPNTV